MKKLMFAALLLVGGMWASAQINPHAIGLRFGGGNSFGTEVSYQHGLKNNNRLELDLGLHSRVYYSAFSLTGAYQWVMPIENGFAWYVGPAAQIGSWSYKSKYDLPDNDDDGLWVGLGGQVGVEYQFDIPLQLSVDFRPMFGINYYDSFAGDLAFSVRYTF